MLNNLLRSFALKTILLSALAPCIHATTVQFQTVLGNFEVNLYDETTPLTVANFLEYVENSDYTDTFFHRSVSGFIIQGGGFVYDSDSDAPVDITSRTAVSNEPVHGNVRGTIAMAKLGGDPNSATSQWYFNLADNRANLDGQNGGFTVFGEITGAGMEVIDSIASLPRINLGQAPFNEVPVRDYSESDASNQVSLSDEHLLMVTQIIVLDNATNTAASLTPPVNSVVNSSEKPVEASGGGGSVDYGILLMLLMMTLARVAPSKIKSAT